MKRKLILGFVGIFLIVGYCIISLFGNFKKDVYAYDTHITEVQEKLKELGYYNGSVNGNYDDATVVAIKNFQRDNGIYVSGAVGGVTANALGIYMSEQESNDLYLLAKCIHAEARGEPYVGKVAVGAVILNRVADPDFPNTIYGVIYQPWAFTAVHDGQINLEPEAASYQAATDALNGWDPTYGCIYYYNPATASSSWIFSRQTVTTIGKHVFAI
jgi:N-acetylmuramoyl-L-alanine amidase